MYIHDSHGIIISTTFRCIFADGSHPLLFALWIALCKLIWDDLAFSDWAVLWYKANIIYLDENVSNGRLAELSASLSSFPNPLSLTPVNGYSPELSLRPRPNQLLCENSCFWLRIFSGNLSMTYMTLTASWGSFPQRRKYFLLGIKPWKFLLENSFSCQILLKKSVCP